MQFLLLSFLALAMGPLLVALARRHAFTTVAVDAFCVLTISGFALLHVLPESAEQAGWLVLPLALVGFIAPTLAERGLQRDSAGLRRIVLVLALLGMAAHDTLDGLGLAIGAGHGRGGVRPDGEVLAYAVILHRIPEGVGIWWILPRTLGTRAAVLVTAVTVVATAIGFWLGDDLLAGSTRSLAMLQALLAGSLLHVVLHAHVPAPREQTRWHVASFAGAAAALAVLWFVVHDHFPPGGEHGGPGQVFLHLAIESAPALLLAYVLVGLCHEFLPATWLQQLTRGSTLTQALRGVAIGLPLPACSCGVVPLYRELVQKGVPLSAALAFLVATPELDVAALLLTWRLMGGEIALVRIGMAALLALSIGVVVGSLRGKPPPAAVGASDAAAPPPPPAGPGRRLAAALRFGFGPAVDNTASWILVGLLLSAMLMPYVQHDWIASLPAGIDVPIAALLGLPLYVCATGSTPFAAMLLGVGMSPGAVLAFMLMGPATNVTTIGVLARLNGGRIAFWFAACMWGGTVALGFAANWCLSAATPTVLQGSAHDHGALAWVLLFALAGVFLVALLRQGVRAFLGRLFESPANTPHEHDHAAAPSCCAEPVACATGPVAAPGHDHAHHGDHGHHH